MSLAPSSLAKKERAFASWGGAIGLIHGGFVPPHIKNDLGTLLVFKPPRSLLELRDEEGIASSRINSFQRPIQQWASSNLSELQDGDTEEIARVWTNLSYAHHKIVKSTAKSCHKNKASMTCWTALSYQGMIRSMMLFSRLDYASVVLSYLIKILVLSWRQNPILRSSSVLMPSQMP
ncbi:hypothetical protein K439DRAFT_856553 [Ramaria rubella]|nr:hypothetical protein K439DRAFT_856553 [Ramaria rubella]